MYWVIELLLTVVRFSAFSLIEISVLVHPNVKVFVSNGGICGIHEALDSGIPVVGVPMLGDQPRNIDSLINLGMAVRVDFDKMNKTDFYKQVMKVVVNKT